MEHVKLRDASPAGTVQFEFLIDERYANVNGVMHGGAAGVIFDSESDRPTAWLRPVMASDMFGEWTG